MARGVGGSDLQRVHADRRRADVAVARQLLHHPNVGSQLQQRGGERMLHAGRAHDARATHRLAQIAPQPLVSQGMAAPEGEHRQDTPDLDRPRLARMARARPAHDMPHPMSMGLLGASAAVQRAKPLLQHVEKSRKGPDVGWSTFGSVRQYCTCIQYSIPDPGVKRPPAPARCSDERDRTRLPRDLRDGTRAVLRPAGPGRARGQSATRAKPAQPRVRRSPRPDARKEGYADPPSSCVPSIAIVMREMQVSRPASSRISICQTCVLRPR